MRYSIKILIFLIVTTKLQAQDITELKMNFPGIYFKHQSTEYAAMPYTVDSCFNYIAAHIKDINDLVIWRDSLETEKLTKQRIKKLKASLNKHKEARNIYIESMNKAQKISRATINASTDSAKIKYLLSLNSVFEIAQTRSPTEPSKAMGHILRPKIWCWKCWITGFHMDKSGRAYRKAYKYRKQKEKK